jgi:hypothetical protein
MTAKENVNARVYINPMWLRGYCDALGRKPGEVRKRLAPVVSAAARAETSCAVDSKVLLQAAWRNDKWTVYIFWNGARGAPKGANIRGVTRAVKSAVETYLEGLKP